jgi:hypothetical protein
MAVVSVPPQDAVGYSRVARWSWNGAGWGVGDR